MYAYPYNTIYAPIYIRITRIMTMIIVYMPLSKPFKRAFNPTPLNLNLNPKP